MRGGSLASDGGTYARFEARRKRGYSGVRDRLCDHGLCRRHSERERVFSRGRILRHRSGDFHDDVGLSVLDLVSDRHAQAFAARSALINRGGAGLCDHGGVRAGVRSADGERSADGGGLPVLQHGLRVGVDHDGFRVLVVAFVEGGACGGGVRHGVGRSGARGASSGLVRAGHRRGDMLVRAGHRNAVSPRRAAAGRDRARSVPGPASNCPIRNRSCGLLMRCFYA